MGVGLSLCDQGELLFFFSRDRCHCQLWQAAAWPSVGRWTNTSAIEGTADMAGKPLSAQVVHLQQPLYHHRYVTPREAAGALQRHECTSDVQQLIMSR